eukprot:9751316-Lingulodinium_polyedra.AAC.1
MSFARLCPPVPAMSPGVSRVSSGRGATPPARVGAKRAMSPVRLSRVALAGDDVAVHLSLSGHTRQPPRCHRCGDQVLRQGRWPVGR